MAGRAGPEGGKPPPRARRSALNRPRGFWPLLLVFVLLVGAAAGGLALHRFGTGDRLGEETAAHRVARTPAIDLTERSAAVAKVLARRAEAVRRNQLSEFLADVDPGNKALLARQRVLFGNLVQFGFSRLGYEQLREQFEQTLVERFGPSAYVVQVAMTYQISGIDRVPVRTMLGYTFTRQPDGRWILVDDTAVDRWLPRGSHQEAWDVGPVLVQRAPRVLVVVERGATALAADLAAKAVNAVRAVGRRWPGGWTGAGVVIALDDKAVRGADYTLPQNAEDALAMATWVYRTLPGEVDSEGERADSYVVVNPRNRAQLDARTLAHEFTHVATARYGAYAPRWLVEGVATYVEFLPMDGELDLALDKYRASMRSRYLATARGLPADATLFQNSKSSYPLSWLAADYLFRRFGPTKVSTLYQQLATGGTSQDARNRIMLAQLGMTETGLFNAL